MAAPVWRESPLSTRSMSYVSISGSPISPLSPGVDSRRPSLLNPHASLRKNVHPDRSAERDIIMTEPDAALAIPPIAPHQLPSSVSNSLLFELPREIRDRIYSLCLAARNEVPVEWPTAGHEAATNQRPPTGIEAQLLRTCHIIYDETAPVLYSQNTLAFSHPSDANIFVRAIASAIHARQITQLDLDIRSQDLRLWTPYISSSAPDRSLDFDFPNLRQLRIRFRSTKWQVQHSHTGNLQALSEDSRLDELLSTIRHLFTSHPAMPPGTKDFSDDEYADLISRHPLQARSAAELSGLRHNLAQRRKLLPTPSSQACRRDFLGVSVCCASRVPPAQFAALTAHLTADRPANDPSLALASPVQPYRDGQSFRGFFAPVDFIRIETLPCAHGNLSAVEKVARTAFVGVNMLLLAIEVSCLDLNIQNTGIAT